MIAIVTGSTGLIGSETVRFFAAQGMDVIGIDNDMRSQFFGQDASTAWNIEVLEKHIENYQHINADIRDEKAIEDLFAKHGANIGLIIHCAAQPSHDWAAKDPFTDFTVNANGTLIMLEMTRRYCPEAVFIFTSTNKVYGDTANNLPLIELDKRWEVDEDHPFFTCGIDESMSIDYTKHSLFGVSKASADLMVQEYGRYFGMKTACFRGGCLTGPAHSGTELHGFLSYLMRCAVEGRPYTVFGYKGKQVRDNIHSYDLVNAFWHFYNNPKIANPKIARVYNIGGSRHSNCSMLEAIDLCQEITGKELDWTYCETNRIGDHMWWVSDVQRLQNDFPEWSFKYDLIAILEEIHTALRERPEA